MGSIRGRSRRLQGRTLVIGWNSAQRAGGIYVGCSDQSRRIGQQEAIAAGLENVVQRIMVRMRIGMRGRSDERCVALIVHLELRNHRGNDQQQHGQQGDPCRVVLLDVFAASSRHGFVHGTPNATTWEAGQSSY